MMRMVVDRTDEMLASDAARGDRVAFDELVARHRAPIVSFCRDLVRDGAEAEDRAQEAFPKPYLGLGRFDASPSLILP